MGVKEAGKEKEEMMRERIINAHRPPAFARIRRFGPNFSKKPGNFTSD
jgi:hypothetical protein